MSVVILCCFCPHYLALRVKQGCHTSCSSPQPSFRQLPVFYGQLYTAFLHYHYRASFLRFATSLNNVRFVSSVSLSAHHSPPAANNFCVPFGLLRLRVCHTFCKEKKQQKDMPNPCVNGAAPRTSCFRVPPSARARAFFRFQLHRLQSGTLRLRWTSLPPWLNCLF